MLGWSFVAKDGDKCAVLETASLSDDEAVSRFLSHLRFLAENSPIVPPDDVEDEPDRAVYSV